MLFGTDLAELVLKLDLHLVLHLLLAQVVGSAFECSIGSGQLLELLTIVRV